MNKILRFFDLHQGEEKRKLFWKMLSVIFLFAELMPGFLPARLEWRLLD